MKNNIEKTACGTNKDIVNGFEQLKYFKFTIEDIGKFIVISNTYEQKMMCGGLFGTQLKINGHELNGNDLLFGVYNICYHPWCKESKNVSYKIYLKPIDEFMPWCQDRSWYTSDMEFHINNTYNPCPKSSLFSFKPDWNC